MTVRRAIGKAHLWLGLASGLVVLFLGVTGCILAFQREIEMITVPYQYVAPREAAFIQPSEVYKIARKELPGKVAHSVTYGKPNKAAVVTFYHSAPDYYYLVYLNPYTGEVLKVKDMSRDFFRIVVDGHFYLWLPPTIGKPIVASATLVFVVMMITGVILWWPKNKAARKQRFSVKWGAHWKRVNYDLHNVLGFYMTWVAIFIAITGLVWGFQWVGNSIYWLASGGSKAPVYYEPVSKVGAPLLQQSAVDAVYAVMKKEYPSVETIEVHFPETDSSAVGGAANPDAATYWKTDYRYYDQYTLAEIPVKHMYGRLKDASAADRIARINYDLHVGAALGLPGKIMAFCASLIAASLPVTGFYIWWGRKRKKQKH